MIPYTFGKNKQGKWVKWSVSRVSSLNRHFAQKKPVDVPSGNQTWFAGEFLCRWCSNWNLHEVHVVSHDMPWFPHSFNDFSLRWAGDFYPCASRSKKFWRSSRSGLWPSWHQVGRLVWWGFEGTVRKRNMMRCYMWDIVIWYNWDFLQIVNW